MIPERQRRWRAANPEKVHEQARRSMAKWRMEHPDAAREIDEQRKALRATNEEWRRARNARVKVLRDEWKGVPEKTFHASFQAQHPEAISMDSVRPDFYVPDYGFVEIKRALPVSRYNWRSKSIHFPGLYFMYGVGTSTDGHKRPSIDDQLELQPRPLLVIVYHAISGEELARKQLT